MYAGVEALRAWGVLSPCAYEKTPVNSTLGRGMRLAEGDAVRIGALGILLMVGCTGDLVDISRTAGADMTMNGSTDMAGSTDDMDTTGGDMSMVPQAAKFTPDIEN